MQRIIMWAVGIAAGGIMYLLPAGLVAVAAYTIGVVVVGTLTYAIGSTRERRPTPPQYRRAEPVEPTITAITPGRARPALNAAEDDEQ